MEHSIYPYMGGWNLSALVWTLLGFGIYNIILDIYFQSAVCLIITGVGYYITQKFTGQVEVEQRTIKRFTALIK